MNEPEQPTEEEPIPTPELTPEEFQRLIDNREIPPEWWDQDEENPFE